MTRISSAAFPELRWLLSEMRPVWRLEVFSLLSIVAASMLTVAGPLLLRWLIDDVLKTQRIGLLLAGAALYGITLIGQLAFGYGGFLLSGWAVERLTFSIRMKCLRKLHNVSATYHEQNPTGEIQYRLEQDVDRVGELGADILPSMLRMLATGIMVLATMAVLNLKMTLLVLPLLPLFYFLQKKCFAELRVTADGALKKTGATSALLQEHLLGLVQLQLLNRTGFHGRKLARLAAEAAQARMQQRLAQIRFSASSMSVIVLGSAAILAYGGHQVISRALTVGGLVAFYTYVAQLFGPLNTAVDLQSRIQRVGASIRRILEIGKEARCDTIIFPCTIRPVTPLFLSRTASLEFDSVSFSHGKSRPVLAGVNLIVDEEEKVAIVGHSGCGKSTVVHLAVGLYSPDQGNIRVEGRDIVNMGRRALRSLVALVPQDPVLFSGTLRENLLYGNPRATNGDLELAVQLAQLEDLLLRLPAGFEEPLGPLGRNLSGGERKRIALARALLQQPRLLILDEVTGALDGLTSTRLMERLEEYRKGRTILLVSHKPATIAWANRIVVLEHGRVVATGSHTDLIRQCDTYQRLCASATDRN